jgi:uncharacterized RDD family membrane protein YckC
MPENIQFETPENVQVSYRPSGLGSRFVAWLIDQLILGLILICTIILLIMFAASMSQIGDSLNKLAKGIHEPKDLPLYFIGIMVLFMGLSSFLYYGLSEYLMNGQTFGKRQLKIRVVKEDGFALDPGAIFLRNILRVLDHLPPLWIIPLVSAKSQRLGDMVAGTLAVHDQAESISGLRERLLKMPASESHFRFDGPALARLRPADFAAVEQLLERWGELPEERGGKLLESICEALARRMNQESPAPELRLRFLQELLAAEFRRQYRQL